MTNNTIPNVSRELLEVIEQTWRIHYHGGPVTTDIAADAIEKGLGQLRDLLSAPSPAGVDGLKRYEVFPYLDDEVAEIDICESDDGSFVKYDAAQAIIDGLRGEVEVMAQHANNYSRMFEECAEERDQQAQRIGELEGLLRHAQKQVPTGSGLHMRIDAALSAVCAAAPNIAPTSEHSGS